MTALRQAFQSVIDQAKNATPRETSNILQEESGNLGRIAYHAALAEVRTELLELSTLANDLRFLRSGGEPEAGVQTADSVLSQLPACEQDAPSPEPDEPSPEPSPEAPATNVVAEFSGSGIQSTRPFTVDGEWEIRWQASGDLFQAYVYRGGTRALEDVAANDTCPCRGRDYQPVGGRYYLDINAIGDWTVTIVDL